MSVKRELSILFTAFKDRLELPEAIQILIDEAEIASKQSYSPYSNFAVGAAVLLNSGEIIRGSNQENAAYPSGLCAERVAMFYANSAYPSKPVRALAVIAVNRHGIIQEPVPPCGSCRQVLVETEGRYNQAMQVYLIGANEIYAFNSATDLLPFNFKSSYLL